MNKEEITQRVMEIACEVYGDDINVRHITPTTDLINNFGFDSLDLTKLSDRLESEFNIVFDVIYESQLGARTPSDFASVIYKLINE